ncbi:MAG TPA: glycosyltransferase family 4 protein [Polyangiales bacterium]|nr:glycosyltransferase family 4 protein [Polyangiales bacterium]
MPARARLGIPEGTQFHVLSFEGPDPYARIGGLETRVAGLCEALVHAGLETHLWFVGQPDLPGYERRDGLHLHRWCQWLSQYHPVGVYDGQDSKVPDYAASLPPVLLRDWLGPHLAAGGRAVVMAEEWQTADALLHLDHLVERLPGKHQAQVRMFWNANNVFGFDRVDWTRMRRAALVTTVSRYMKQLMQVEGVEAVVLPNGLSPDAYLAPDRPAVQQLRKTFAGRIAITKMARWDPDKNWLGSIEIIAHMKQLGLRPLLIARGGLERHGLDVLRAMKRAGLRVAERDHAESGVRGLVQALSDTASVDVLNVTRHVDRDSRRALFRASDVVLANSAKEPFGLVGLEAMAVGGIGCTGLTGEDYVMPGRNALVLQTSDPSEFVKLYMPLRADPEYEAAMRRAGRATARQYAWPEVIRTALAPRLGLSRVD